MRVLDLLVLLHDYQKSTPVRVQLEAQALPFGAFETRTVNEQPQLLLHQVTGKPLQVWETMMLLDRPDWRQRYVYVVEKSAVRPLFGLQERPGGLVVN